MSFCSHHLHGIKSLFTSSPTVVEEQPIMVFSGLIVEKPPLQDRSTPIMKLFPSASTSTVFMYPLFETI